MNNSPSMIKSAKQFSELTNLSEGTCLELLELISYSLVHQALTQFSESTEEVATVSLPILNIGTMTLKRHGSGLPLECSIRVNDEFIELCSSSINSGQSPLIEYLSQALITKITNDYNSISN